MSDLPIEATEGLLEIVVSANGVISDIIDKLPPEGTTESLENCLECIESIGTMADAAGFAALTTIAEDLHTHFGVEAGVLTADAGEVILRWLDSVVMHVESPEDISITESLLTPLPKEIKAEMRTVLGIPEVEQEDEVHSDDDLNPDSVDVASIDTGNGDSGFPREIGGDEEVAPAGFELLKTDNTPVVDNENLEFAMPGTAGVELPGDSDVEDIDMSMFEDDESMEYGSDSMLGILASELHSVSPQLKVLAELMTSSEDSGEMIEAVGSYQELVYRVSMASEGLGLQGLVLVCNFVNKNMLLVVERSLVERAICLEVLQGWPQVVIDHLLQPRDDALCLAVVDYLEKGNWPEPLPYSELRDLIEGLTKELEMTGDYEVEPREKLARPEDVELEMSEDASPQLIEAFFAESPGHAEKFSSLVKAIAKGEEMQSNVEAAQRIAHTLKGSGNLVGAKGIANLSHHIEDIFDFLARGKTTPPVALASTMQEAADTIEVMLEFMQGMAAAPEDAQRVLQDVLDWANRIDQGNIRESDFNKEGMIPVMALGGGAMVEPEIRPEEFSDDRRASQIPSRRADDTPKVATQGRAEGMLVSADVMDNIFRIVGETAIAIGQIQEHLKRLDGANKMVRKNDVSLQQRRYELENLVSIRSMAARHGSAVAVGSDGDFDPLEMDEYDEFYGLTHSYIEGVADSREILRGITDEVSDLNALFLLQQRLNKELQQMVMTMRMVPVRNISARLQRAVRQVCRTTGKQAELKIIGENLLLDGDVLNQLTDPLMHMLRNSVDHSIEVSSDRVANGKSEAGNISLSFLQEGNSVVVACVDDGTGLNYKRIRETAVKHGLITRKEKVDDASLARLIIQSGFSTSDNVTQVSGRGVGLDVVHHAIQTLNGTMDITDAVAGGTQISLRLPITLLTSHCLLVSGGKDTIYAIPTSTLVQILSPGTGKIGNVGGNMTFQLGQDVYPARSLSSLTEVADSDDISQNGTVLLVQTTDGVTAIIVDRVVSSHDLVVKNMGAYVKQVPGVAGVSTLGDGRVVAVLDLSALLNERDNAGTGNKAYDSGLISRGKVAELPKILVVDDSLSVRQSLSQLVGDGGYRVVTARDGIEAVAMLEKELPDLVLTDLEMPRMNGLELTSYIRKSEQWKPLPVVMITSRTMAKHRQQAEAVGVDHYITKPFAEDDVLASISERLTQVLNQAK